MAYDSCFTSNIKGVIYKLQATNNMKGKAMAQQETKRIDTEFGIIEIVNTGIKVYYDYGRKGYMRNAWKDSEGRIWVAHFNRFNLLKRENFGKLRMYANQPFGYEVKAS